MGILWCIGDKRMKNRAARADVISEMITGGHLSGGDNEDRLRLMSRRHEQAWFGGGQGS